LLTLNVTVGFHVIGLCLVVHFVVIQLFFMRLLLWTPEFMSIQWCQSDQVGVS